MIKWEVGKPYIITKIMDDTDSLVGVYCDVSRPVERTFDGFAFDDLYLDVWQPVDDTPTILDEDKLEAAVAAGFVSQCEADEARRVAEQLVRVLTDGVPF